jgi:hypothetical protein
VIGESRWWAKPTLQTAPIEKLKSCQLSALSLELKAERHSLHARLPNLLQFNNEFNSKQIKDVTNIQNVPKIDIDRELLVNFFYLLQGLFLFPD